MSTVNLDVLDAALAHIAAHPEQHDQRHWIVRGPDCGTAMCLAGVVAWQAGWAPEWSTGFSDNVNGNAWMDTADVTRDGKIRLVSSLAAELLGIGWRDADRLFAPDNTLADLRRIRDELAERAL